MPALKGLAETWLSEAGAALEEFVDLRAEECCSRALEVLVRAAKCPGGGGLACIWKLMGDACTMLRELSAETFGNFVLPKELSLSEGEKVGKKTVLEVGGRCYQRAARCDPELPSCWRDLALNFHARAVECEGGDEKLVARALGAAKKQVALMPKSAQAWNLLGFLAVSWEK